MASTEAAAAVKTFFSSSKFAVAGASSDQSKFGHKIFVWYLNRFDDSDIKPINPSAPSITALGRSHSTVPSPSEIKGWADPTQTSLSIITPPKVTLKVLEKAKEEKIPAVWLQPGSFDDEGIKYARANFKAAIGGTEGAGGEGWCVLVHGDAGLRAAGKGKL